MTERQSLLNSPLAEWTYELVNDFLRQRTPESDGIEYKATFSETLPDTLCSMANGSGGFIFVGVSETDEKRPNRWPLLEPAQLKIATVYNLASSEVTPALRLEAVALPSEQGGYGVVAVRIEPGNFPPYFVKQRGVRIRVADADVVADPRMLEQLFARREDLVDLQARHREGLERTIAYSWTTIGVTFHAHVAPLWGSWSLALNELTSRTLRRVVEQFVGGPIDPSERRWEDWVKFGNDKDRVLTFWKDGGIDLAVLYEDPPVDAPGRQPAVSVIALAQDLLDVLNVAKVVYPALAGFSDDLYVGVAVHGLGARPLSWPGLPGLSRRLQGSFMQERRINQGPIERWYGSSPPFSVRGDSVSFTRDALSNLAWRAGYQGAEAYLQWWADYVRPVASE